MSTTDILSLGEDRLFLFFMSFLLCLARTIGFFVQAPIWGSNHINKQVKVGLSAGVAIVIFPYIPIPDALPGGPFTFILLVASQITVGLVIGFVAFIPMAMAQFGGELMDIQMGLSSAAANDPSSKGTINLIRRLKFYIAMIVYLILNGHHVLLDAIARSFEIVPLTGVRFSSILITELIRITSELLYVGVQIGLPVLGALFMIQIALGIMAKVAPQMNVFMLSFPLNILMGLTILVSSIPLFVARLKPLFSRNFNDVVTAIRMIVP